MCSISRRCQTSACSQFYEHDARKKEVYDQFVNEYQKTLDEKKKELKASIEATKKENDEHYMQQLSSLSSYFEAHKDEWIAKMVAACKE